MTPWPALLHEVHTALACVVARARRPPERVARHWEDASVLRWFGVGTDGLQLHASWSFGKLRGVTSTERPTVGVFAITRANFAEVSDERLAAALDALVSSRADGPTRLFLRRVALQLALSEALLSLRPADEIFFFARPDALETPAATPRWPEHARDRVALALAEADAGFTARLEAVLLSPHATLLDAVGGAVLPGRVLPG